jgi:hypothetical protein
MFWLFRLFMGIKYRDEDTRQNKEDNASIDGHDRNWIHVYYYYLRRYLARLRMTLLNVLEASVMF